MKRTKLFLFYFFLLFFPCVILAQVSPNIDSSQDIYRSLEKLRVQGLIKTAIVGQNPISKNETFRQLKEAQKNLETLKNNSQGLISEKRINHIETLIKHLQKHFPSESSEEKKIVSFHFLDEINIDLLQTNSLDVNLKENNGIARINAKTNSLLNYQQGRHYVSGANLGIETKHWFSLSPYFMVYGQPRFQLSMARDGVSEDNGVFVQKLYSKFNFKNIELEVGRDELNWGQAPNGGLLLSHHARPFDLIKVSNDHPIILPWIFKYLGPSKFSFFYADLGPEQYFPHAYFAGHKMSFKPTSFFEFGFSLIDHAGGEGGPQASLSDRVLTAAPLVGLVVYPFKDIEISNRIAGLDFRFQIPPARGLELYSEVQFDDVDVGRLKSMFLEDGSFMVGAYLPRLDDAGKMDLRLEYHHTGLRFYRHGQFFNGWTLNRNIVGDPLGPDAYGYYGDFSWDINPGNLIKLSAAYEKRSGDLWSVQLLPGWTFVKTADLTDEERYRIHLNWLHRLEKFPLSFVTQLAYERVHNFNFDAGVNKNNLLAQFKLMFDLEKWTKVEY